MKKVMIAVPCMAQVPIEFCESLVMLEKPDNMITKFARQAGSLVYTSRNSLALRAMQEEADYVMWFDSDMSFQPDTLVRMLEILEKNDLDMLSCLYFRRVRPYSPVLFDQLDIDETNDICKFHEPESIPDGLFEIAACGFGGVLMRADVLFDVQGRFGNMFAPMGNNGEDVAFCWRARQCGNRIWCDSSLVFGHIGSIAVDRNFYESYRGVLT